MTYEQSLLQLESIVQKMEQGQYSVDELAAQLQTAQKLIKLCRDKLTKTDEEIKKILGEEK